MCRLAHEKSASIPATIKFMLEQIGTLNANERCKKKRKKGWNEIETATNIAAGKDRCPFRSVSYSLSHPLSVRSQIIENGGISKMARRENRQKLAKTKLPFPPSERSFFSSLLDMGVTEKRKGKFNFHYCISLPLCCERNK